MTEISIKNTKEEFRKWRLNRSGKRSPAPERLRRLAVELSDRYGINHVHKELNISWSVLWKWRRIIKMKPVRKKQTCVVPKFLEVTAATVSSLPKPSPIVLEWGRSDGTVLKVTGISVHEVSQLATLFLASEKRLAD